MRIYEGSPRQDFEEVLRSIGAFLDQRGMREILLLEVPDGFVVQGLAVTAADAGGWAESVGNLHKETLTFFDDDIARFMDEAAARRNAGQPTPDFAIAGHYEKALRVIGRWMDGQKPRDIFFFEQDGAFVLRLLHASQTRLPAHAGRVHARRHRPPGGGGAGAARRALPTTPNRRLQRSQRPQRPDPVGSSVTPTPTQATEVRTMKAMKIVAAALGITLATLVVLPLLVLTGLFVWLKLTEEADEEALELEAEAV